MKKIIALSVWFVCALASAQTFTTNNLVVNGTFTANNGAFVHTVLNVAALRATSCVSGLIYQTQGYTTIADNGSAQYVCVGTDTTSTDNGGSIIAAANGVRYHLIYTTQMNAKTFGAYGDNIHDDTTPIQNALTFVGANGGGTVALSPSSAPYMTTLQLEIPSYTTLQGVSASGFPFNGTSNAVILNANFSNANQWVMECATKVSGSYVAYNTILTSLPSPASYNVGIRDLQITSSGTVPFGAIRIHGCDGATIDNVSVVGTGIGLLLNESIGDKIRVHTLTQYYGVIGWNDVNANTIDAYSTLNAPLATTVPSAYQFPPLATIGPNLVTTNHMSATTYQTWPIGFILGANNGSNSVGNQVNTTNEFWSVGTFQYFAQGTAFGRLYVEGSASQVQNAVAATNSTFTVGGLNAFLSGTGNIFDLGIATNATVGGGLVSAGGFGNGPYTDALSYLVIQNSQASSYLTTPKLNVLFPNDTGAITSPTFTNSWSNCGGLNEAAGFRKNQQDGNVELYGCVVGVGGSTSLPAFTLPAGYRPNGTTNYPCVNGTTIIVCSVTATGMVTPVGGTPANGVWIGGISFRQEQ